LERASLDGGVELEYEAEGDGEPVLLVHGSLLADGLSLLRRDSTLNKRYRLVSYSRQGFAGSTHPNKPLSISEQATDCRNLLSYVGLAKAHVVGHSYGGNIALQLAIDAPDRVQSLSLLEGGLPFEAIFPKTITERIGQEMMRAMQMYQKGDKSNAIDSYLKFVAGPDVRSTLNQVLPGAYEQAIRDADTFFQIELPALRSWSLSAVQTKSIRSPTLIVMGAKTLFADAAKEAENRIANEWFPEAERVWIPEATHFSQLSNLEGLSEALNAFMARHPMVP
jgi:pimeloyl-ACP methyl ester carboxylesterase